MSLKQWVENRWIRPYKTSSEEISNLFSIVDRDLNVAEQDINSDWRFGIAYNAALKLCTILLYASGYKAERSLQHYRTIQSITLILGEDKQADAAYLDSCRKKRNIVEYDYVGGISASEVDELTKFVKEFKKEITNWLNNNYPELTNGL